MMVDNKLKIPACEDFHCHLREGDMLKTVVPLLKKGGASRVLVMPNLIPPVTTVQRALEYKKTLQKIKMSPNKRKIHRMRKFFSSKTANTNYSAKRSSPNSKPTKFLTTSRESTS